MKTGNAYCSQTCNQDSDCPGNDLCMTSDMGMICRKNVGTPPDSGGGTTPDAGGGGGDTQPPQVSITSPGNGVEVSASITVVVQASDDTAVSKVELKVDGVVAASQNGTPYEFSISLQPGGHTITAVAYDAAQNSAEASVTVTVAGGGGGGGTLPEAAPEPPGGPDGGGGGPTPPTPGQKGVFGSICGEPSDCESNICIFDSAYNAHYCAEPCGAGSTCPYVNAECVQGGGGVLICALTSAPQDPQNPVDPNGPNEITAPGCNLGHDPLDTTAGFVTLGLLGMLLLSRRRS